MAPRERDSWRRLRFVIDQARAWSEAEHGGLRAYLAWAAAQSAETSRVAESVLPESDVDSVRIMTIHAAKGLEFPMVVLSGMTAQPRKPGGVQLFWKDDGYAVRALEGSGDGRLPGAGAARRADERATSGCGCSTSARHERATTLWCPCTGAARRRPTRRKLADAGAAGADAVELERGETTPPSRGQVSQVGTPPLEYAAWLDGVRAAADASRRRPSISASGLEGTDPDALQDVPGGSAVAPDSDVAPDRVAPDTEVAAGLAKGTRDVEAVRPGGREGTAPPSGVPSTACCRQSTWPTGHALEDAVAAQCVAEGVVDFEPLVAALVRSALDSEVVQRAAAREHWRESYVGIVQDDGTVLEGIVDLIYREDDGSLVIVDYKTDDVPDSALASRVAYYAPQLGAYADLLASATDTSAPAKMLLFARPAGEAVAQLC